MPQTPTRYGPLPKTGTICPDDYGGYIVFGDLSREEAIGRLAFYVAGPAAPEAPKELVDALTSTARTVVLHRVLASQDDLAEPGSFHTDGHGASVAATAFERPPIDALDAWASALGAYSTDD